MNTDLQPRKQKSSLKGAPPDPKLEKSPTQVPMERLLMLEVNVLNIFFQELEKLQTLTLPLKTKKYDKESHSDSLTDS